MEKFRLYTYKELQTLRVITGLTPVQLSTKLYDCALTNEDLIEFYMHEGRFPREEEILSIIEFGIGEFFAQLDSLRAGYSNKVLAEMQAKRNLRKLNIILWEIGIKQIGKADA